MASYSPTREQMWSKQRLSAPDIDYGIWERDKSMLEQFSKINRSCTFVVDVYRGCYAFASPAFAALWGYDSHKLATLDKQGDYLESRIHPDDFSRLESLQIRLAEFIYRLPIEQRNDYRNLYSFRMCNVRGRYVRVIGKTQVLEPTRCGKAWLILGNIDIAPDQKESDRVDCSVLHLKTGEIRTPLSLSSSSVLLTARESEILQLIRQGLLSKEIACKLGISIHTVHVHRQNLFRKLGVQNSLEAVRAAQESGLIG